ncbi:helix-turn-helix domain-containing protein [Aliivibrio fischeri]|uniref:helix-turn-helix domain-containing protein n=1 Tax=Aliivibrio fischeri TaxID=668 RepID=UPI0012DA5C35|nr:helix-turn-helix transcriptional regulator [Aliivibrio fischeri]MUK42837.1 helix-turn-helix domain-containing protein [Aliivibrio fischeri]
MLPIGQTIKELRLLKGLSLAQVAQLSNIDKSYLSKIENNKRDPSITSLEKICIAIEVPLSILILMCDENKSGPFSTLTDELKELAREIIRV